MENIITLSKLKKEVISEDGTQKTILEDIDLSVKKGEFICIVGPSGCGKSVLLSILGGIEKGSSGTISFMGNDCSRKMTKEQKKEISYVFQQDYLLAWRNVYKNVRLPLEIMKIRKDERIKVMEALTQVGLEKYADCYPKELSGGMRQRVGIARALVKDAELMLLDQPFGALDAITRKTLAYQLLNICHETEKSVIMITNQVEEALLLANRICVMSSLPGKIIHEIEVPFNYEEKTGDLSANTEYLQLKQELESYVK